MLQLQDKQRSISHNARLPFEVFPAIRSDKIYFHSDYSCNITNKQIEKIQPVQLLLVSKMYQIQLKFKGQNKKITIAKQLPRNELHKLIAQCFNISERIVGVTNKSGKFFQLSELNQQMASSAKQNFSLVTAKDLNQDSMSFASQHYQRHNKQDFQQQLTETTLQIPVSYSSKCLGTVNDLELFEQFILTEGKISIVACYTKTKPNQPQYQYYLYKNQLKNSLVVYSGHGKVCEFYVNDWNNPNPQIGVFVQGIVGENQTAEESRRSGQFKKRQKIGQGELLQNQQNQNDQDAPDNAQIRQELLQKFHRLFSEGQLSEIEYYKLKSQVLQNPQDFMRKYQMGTRLGLRTESRSEVRSKEQRRGVSPNRSKKYEIPIIVRKYNNVVQKISTSYPLTLEQEQAINLILQLELKGLISQKEAGQFKSMILQEDAETFKLFREYFEDTVDQIELANKLRKKKGTISREESRQRGEHIMRLLIKHAKQGSYQLLRKLVLQDNKYVLGAMQVYRSTKNVEQFAAKLQKIANFYRVKQELQDIQSI